MREINETKSKTLRNKHYKETIQHVFFHLALVVPTVVCVCAKIQMLK